MWKLLSLSLISSALLFAEEASVAKVEKVEKVEEVAPKVKELSADEKIFNFQKARVMRNPDLELKNLEIFKKVDFEEMKGWSAYIFNLDLYLKNEKQNIKTQDILFTDGNFVTVDLNNIKTSKSLRESIEIDAPANYYDDEHFLAGNKEAKNKLLVFSDPLCPFCMDFVPEVIKFVKDNSQDLALYYYHFPIISIHPASGTLIKASIAAEHKGAKDVVERLYAISSGFDARENNESAILNSFNEKLQTNVTLQEINNPEVQAKYVRDIERASDIMVRGTPTLFINGKVDKSKKAYLDLIKKEVK